MLVSKTLSARRSTGSRTVITGVSITFSEAGLFWQSRSKQSLAEASLIFGALPGKPPSQVGCDRQFGSQCDRPFSSLMSGRVFADSYVTGGEPNIVFVVNRLRPFQNRDRFGRTFGHKQGAHEIEIVTVSREWIEAHRPLKPRYGCP